MSDTHEKLLLVEYEFRCESCEELNLVSDVEVGREPTMCLICANEEARRLRKLREEWAKYYVRFGV